MLAPGSTFAGYEIEGVVGLGGLGILYRARQLRLDRPVALKIVEAELARDPVVRERLRREARAVAALDHPNVVPLYEAGEYDGTIYNVTRWVEGTELGILYRARQLRLDRPVALKVVEGEAAGDPVVRERLRREARAVASMDHPNVVPLYEAGEYDGTIYIVTRWVEGTELGILIDDEGPLEPRRAARIAAQIGAALEIAHEKGLVHRDVKPSNVIITSEDHAYLTDFGLAKRAETAAGLTRADQMLGTVDYVAPEQIEGSEADARGDIYSLGCVLYEMLTGEPPFSDQRGGMAKMWAQVNAQPQPLSQRRPDVPAPLDELVSRAMAKDPGARPSATDFCQAALAAIP
jgi:serine/threonine protein kinase